MGKWWKQLQTLFFWSPESLQNDCSHEIKRHLLLGRKVMTNLDSMLKSRDITLLTKYGFSVVMYGCGSWTIKKAEHQKIDAFELWCWRSLLRVSWTARRSNQSILKEISPEAPILWPPDAKNWLIWKVPDAGADWNQEEKGMTAWDDWMASPTQWTWVWATSGSW